MTMQSNILRFSVLVGWRDFQLTWSWQSWLFGWCSRVATASIAWVLVGRAMGSPETEHFLLIGQIVLVGASAACLAIPAAAWDRMDGTFEQVILTPSSYVWVLAGRAFVWAMHGALSGLCAGAVLALLFSPLLPLRQIPVLMIAIVAVSVSTYAFALFHGLVAARWPRLRNIVMGLVIVELTVFTGAAVPVSHWPVAMQQLAQFMPLTHALQAVRLDDPDASTVARLLLLELGIFAAWMTLVAVTSEYLLGTIRRRGLDE